MMRSAAAKPCAAFLQLHVGSSRLISAPTLGWLGGVSGWWVVGLPCFPSAQPSPALPTSSPLPPLTPHLHAAQPNQSDPLLCILDTHPRACPRSALPCGCLVCAQNNNDEKKEKKKKVVRFEEAKKREKDGVD